MRETPEELRDLQRLLDASFEQASQHLVSIMTPARRLPAQRLVAELPSPAVLNVATVTAHGEPRVSALDGHFMHGHWYFTTDSASPKARQLRARNSISASYTPRDGYGVFCHGRAALLDPGEDRQMVIDHFVDTYGESPQGWGDILYARIDADWMVAFAMTPDEEAEMVRQRADREARRTTG